jgi:hypothetical protein
LLVQRVDVDEGGDDHFHEHHEHAHDPLGFGRNDIKSLGVLVMRPEEVIDHVPVTFEPQVPKLAHHLRLALRFYRPWFGCFVLLILNHGEVEECGVFVSSLHQPIDLLQQLLPQRL